MKSTRSATLVVVMVAAAGFVAAGEYEGPQPTEEHEALEMWVGTWSGEGELKPGPFGPGGPMTWTDECSWYEDSRFHIVCRSEGSGPMGDMKGLGIIGYNPGKKVYTHYGVDDSGWSGYSEGTKSGDTWTFRSEETMDGVTYHTKMVMTEKSPGSNVFSWEISEDGSNWTVLMDGTSTKK